MIGEVNSKASQACPRTPPLASPLAAPAHIQTPVQRTSASSAPLTPFTPAAHGLLDSFPDSDDSWLRDMSPVWAAEYDVCLEEERGETEAASVPVDNHRPMPGPSSAFDHQDNGSVVFTGFRRTVTPPPPPSMDLDSESEDEKEVTPGKRGRSQESEAAGVEETPKKMRSKTSLVDEIVSPVRRTLNI